MIRKAEVSDYAAIAALEKSVHAIHHINRPDVFLPMMFDGDVTLNREYFTKCLASDNYKVFVYEENGEILGYFNGDYWGYEGHPVYKDVVVFHINSMGVAKTAQGRGIGRQLIEKAQECAKEVGAARLELTVSAFNSNAKDFYEHMGMKVRTEYMEMAIE